ncbi:MAG: sigma-70 family RNA polymerase sigma factor [Alphaproteobacteria bacterium]
METRESNKASYRNLWQTLAPFVRRNSAAFLARYGQVGMTEDITQEVLLAVHLKLHTYDENLSFVAWVRAVMKHKIIDAFRRNKVKTVSTDAQDYWEISDTENPEIQAVRHDLYKLLGSLKPPAAEVIYALKVEGASVQELAIKHQMSESNIKVIVHRGLRKLSALIASEKAA